MAISSAAFLTGVSTLIRIGQAAQREYRDLVLNQSFEMLAPPGFPPTRSDPRVRVVVATYFRSERPELLEPAAPFHELFADLTSAGIAFDERKPDLIERAIDFYLDDTGAKSLEVAGKSLVISCSTLMAHREWLDPNHLPRWGRLGLEIADIALDVLATQPGVLGLNRRATEIVAALASNMKDLVENDEIAPGAAKSAGERLVHHFMQASLETVSERPELFVSSERWKPIITGVLVPLKDQVAASPGLEFLTRERLGAMLRGPVAHSVLTALSANADAFLTSRFGGDEVLGAVARSVLGAITSADQRGFDLRRVFSDEGAVMVLEAALGVARERPELFVKGLGAAGDAQRDFLRKIAIALDGGPRPFRPLEGLAPQIAAISFEIAGQYASRRLRSGQDDDPWAAAGADVADKLIGEIVAGFKSVVGQGDGANPFERVFNREQAVDVLRIIATHAATTPEMLIGGGDNPEVRNIAVGVAQMVADDTKGLLDGAGWRSVITTAVEIASRNPGALFGVKDSSPEGQVAVTLMRSVLTQAADNMKNGRRAGAILFGDTLREALTATIQAAASNLLALPDASSILTHVDASKLTNHSATLEAFIAHLLKRASDANPEFRMNAEEWLHVYRTFVGHVLSYGPDCFPAPEDSEASELHITDQLILGALQEFVTRSMQRGEVG